MTQQLSTNTFTVAKWVVSADATQGTHTTIAGAIASASSGDTIYIRNGTYTENLTLTAGITLTAAFGDSLFPAVTIIGKITASFTGTSIISNISLKTNSDNFLLVSGSNATIVILDNCYLNCLNNTGISFTSSNSSSSIRINKSIGDVATTGITLYSMTSSGNIDCNYFQITNSGSSTTPSSNSAGSCTSHYCFFQIPFSTSSTGNISGNFSEYRTAAINTTCVTTAGTGTNINFNLCKFSSGSASAISIGAGTSASLFKVYLNSTNANTVTGSGTLTYNDCSSSVSQFNFNVSTQIPISMGPILQMPGPIQIISGTGSPDTSITAPQGSLFLRTDGSTSITRAYINTDGITSWTPITTVG